MELVLMNIITAAVTTSTIIALSELYSHCQLQVRVIRLLIQKQSAQCKTVH